MAHFFTDAQVFRNTLKVLGFLFLTLVTRTGNGQEYEPKKRAVKFYEQGIEEIRSRDFPGGILSFKKAIRIDENFPDPYLRLASAYNVLRLLDSAYTYYDRYFTVSDPSGVTAREAFFMADLYFDNGQYEKAAEVIELGKEKDPDWPADLGKKKLNTNIAFAMSQRHVENPHTIDILPSTVNRFYTQYFPTMTVDGNSLTFTAREGSGPGNDEDLVISYFDGNRWSPARSISSKINSRSNEGACTMSADGRMLIFTSCEDARSFGSCDLFMAVKIGDSWSDSKNLGTEVNSVYWDSQPSLSADGNALYFSSNRKGGYGQRDIWVSYYDGRNWQEPVNLGPNINTELDETTPYIHSNNQTLFYASEGHPGFGGFDLYRSELEDTLWQKPVNLGYGINDHKDQLSMIISVDGTYGFFADEQYTETGGLTSKIARIVFANDTIITKKASYVTGRVTNAKTGEPIRSDIQLNDLESGKMKYHTLSDPVSGRYYFVLTKGNDYGAYVKAKGFLFEDFRFEVGDNSFLKPDTIDIALNPIEQNVGVVLENVYFEFDSYELTDASVSELNVVSEFLKSYDVQVEISGHTDEVGSDEYNRRLSMNRAKSVYEYLVNSGVPKGRMQFEGYGDSQPRFEDKAKNRRIEFKILQVNP